MVELAILDGGKQLPMDNLSQLPPEQIDLLDDECLLLRIKIATVKATATLDEWKRSKHQQ